MHGGSCAGAHFKFALLLALAPAARGQLHQDCAFAPFYQPEELPAIHQLDMTIPQEVFDSLIQHSTDRSYREQTGQLNFNGIQYENVEIMVHGGDPQRGQHGKQSFRLKFSPDDPFGAKHGVPFSFPRDNHCNNLRKLVLRAEWNDHPLANDPNGFMIRNKLTNDILKKAGASTPREDFAEFSVNGNYFGLFGLEEHVSAEFLECQGWDPSTTSLYKANAMGAPSTSWRPSGSPSSDRYDDGWERKLPSCGGCDNGDSQSGPSCDEGDRLPQCDESDWPDKDHCLVCGDCKVLVDQFSSRYQGTCDNYCRALGKTCVGAWEERDDTCEVESTQRCSVRWSSTSDAICQCSPDPVEEQADNVHEESDAEVCSCGRMADDLAQLFEPLNRRGVTEEELSSVLNITDFALWNIATVISENIDTGSHNYYIAGPTAGTGPPAGRLWRVINVDADWGWGHGWCGNCHGAITLIDDNGRSFADRGCPPDGSPQGPELYNFYCSDNHAAEMIASALPSYRGRYLALFEEILSQDFMQPCVLTGAIDALLGPDGVLTAAMNRDVAHWRQEKRCCRGWSLPTQVRFAKGWIRARLSHLNSEVQTELADCDRQRGCTTPRRTDPLTCRMSDPELLQMQCDRSGVTAPTICSQGSVGTSCAHNADLCAANFGAGPCLNGGTCSLRVNEMPSAAVDACGCAAGEGWSSGDRLCQPEKTTSRREAVDCALRLGYPSLTADCKSEPFTTMASHAQVAVRHSARRQQCHTSSRECQIHLLDQLLSEDS